MRLKAGNSICKWQVSIFLDADVARARFDQGKHVIWLGIDNIIRSIWLIVDWSMNVRGQFDEIDLEYLNMKACLIFSSTQSVPVHNNRAPQARGNATDTERSLWENNELTWTRPSVWLPGVLLVPRDYHANQCATERTSERCEWAILCVRECRLSVNALL